MCCVCRHIDANYMQRLHIFFKNVQRLRIFCKNVQHQYKLHIKVHNHLHMLHIHHISKKKKTTYTVPAPVPMVLAQVLTNVRAVQTCSDVLGPHCRSNTNTGLPSQSIPSVCLGNFKNSLEYVDLQLGKTLLHLLDQPKLQLGKTNHWQTSSIVMARQKSLATDCSYLQLFNCGTPADHGWLQGMYTYLPSTYTTHTYT